jgi:prepilin-type N-terminal cleavage/methylation domain-containing protein
MRRSSTRLRKRAIGRDEAGFTLVELLVVLVIMPVIIGAIADVVVTSLKSQNGVSGRLSDSASAEVTSAFYERDVQSAAFVTTFAGASQPQPCGTGSPATSGMTFELGLNWGGTTPLGGANVAYWNSPSTGDLWRVYCPTGSSTPSSTEKVAFGLTATGIQTTVAPSADATAAAAGWTSTDGISGITLAAAESASSYSFDLLGVPRVSSPFSEGLTPGGTPKSPFPPYPLLILGSGSGTGTLLSCGGNGRLNVGGTAYIDSGSSGAAELSGNAQLIASGIDLLTGGTIATSGNASYSPQATGGGSSASDPYSSLTAPTGSAAPSPTSSGGTTTYYPGVYTSLLTLSGNSLNVFASGTYIFDNGISVSGNAYLKSAAGGVLFYVKGGEVSITGNGGLILSPLASPPAPDMVIWQSATDSNSVLVAGNGLAHLISGTIYAPGAQVGGAGNGSYTADAVIAKTFACDGNGTAQIG